MRDNSKKARPANLGDDQHELFRGLRVGKRNKMEMNPVIKKNTNTTHKNFTVS